MSKEGRGQLCTYCRRRLEAKGSRGRLAATRDHVMPKMHGGRRTVWCCRQCNTLKANMMPSEWSEFMRQNPEWWKQDRWRYGIRLRDRREYLGPSTLAARTAVAEVTRNDHAGNLAPDTQQSAVAACAQLCGGG